MVNHYYTAMAHLLIYVKVNLASQNEYIVAHKNHSKKGKAHESNIYFDSINF